MQDTIVEKVINVIKNEFKDGVNFSLKDDTQLSSLDIDSIMFIKIVIALENAFEFEFDDEKLLFSAFPVVSSIIKYVESKMPNSEND